MVESARLHDDADRARLASGPTPAALAAFDVDASELRRLEGGQGNTFTDGRLVLKTTGCVPEHEWTSRVYADWTAHDEVRVPEPVLPADGTTESGVQWSVDQWGAHVFVPGRDTDPVADLELIRETSDAFHAQLAGLARPAFLDTRDDPWAYGDRLAFEGATPEGDAELLAVVADLKAHLAPVSAPDQVIHGDILPNVLIADGLPPAVIDWPPYYRPAAMANAIAITDAVTFRGVSVDQFDAWAVGDDWDQLLLRALLYRLGPTGFFTVRNTLMGVLVTHLQRVRPVAQTVITRVSA